MKTFTSATLIFLSSCLPFSIHAMHLAAKPVVLNKITTVINLLYKDDKGKMINLHVGLLLQLAILLKMLPLITLRNVNIASKSF